MYDALYKKYVAPRTSIYDQLKYVRESPAQVTNVRKTDKTKLLSTWNSDKILSGRAGLEDI